MRHSRVEYSDGSRLCAASDADDPVIVRTVIRPRMLSACAMSDRSRAGRLNLCKKMQIDSRGRYGSPDSVSLCLRSFAEAGAAVRFTTFLCRFLTGDTPRCWG